MTNDELDARLDEAIRAGDDEATDRLFAERIRRIDAAMVRRVGLTPAQIDHVYRAATAEADIEGSTKAWERCRVGATFIEGHPSDLHLLADCVDSDGYWEALCCPTTTTAEDCPPALYDGVVASMVSSAERAAKALRD